MKILMVTMSMNIGGAETHILELCRELVRGGDSVTLASFCGVDAEGTAADKKIVNVKLHPAGKGEIVEIGVGILRKTVADSQ